MNEYNFFLDNIVIPELGNGITYRSELEKYGKKVFGSKFHGVYMRDEIPTNMSPTRKYAVFNLDSSKQPGSHWIAAAYMGPQKLLVYDSFGSYHGTPKSLLEKYPRSITTDSDPEQHLKEENCGARVFAWLLTFEVFGASKARQV